MSLATIVQPVFASLATTIGGPLTYRTLTANVWSATATVYGEIKATAITQETDEFSGSKVKRERATAKLYDQTLTVVPSLKIGDEIIDASSAYWKIHAIDKAEIGNGIYRYHIVRDLPQRGEADRGATHPEGGATAVTGHTMSSFTGTNIEASATLFYGAMAYITTTGVGLARNDVSGKDAIGICTTVGGAAAGASATVAAEGSFTSNDWTAMVGSTTLTKGTLYFLDIAPGKITATPPATGYLQPVGTATSTTTLDLEIVEPIQL